MDKIDLSKPVESLYSNFVRVYGCSDPSENDTHLEPSSELSNTMGDDLSNDDLAAILSTVQDLERNQVEFCRNMQEQSRVSSTAIEDMENSMQEKLDKMDALVQVMYQISRQNAQYIKNIRESQAKLQELLERLQVEQGVQGVQGAQEMQTMANSLPGFYSVASSSNRYTQTKKRFLVSDESSIDLSP